MKKSLFLFCLVCLLIMKSWALQITPSYQMYVVEPGKKVKGEYTIVNTEGEDLVVNPFTKDWFLLKENEKFPSKGWLKIKDEQFVLKKGETKKVQFVARMPRKAVGELVGTVSFKTLSETRPSVNFILTSVVYVGIKGTEKIKGEITGIDVVASSDSIKAAVTLRNKGNVHLRPTGLIRIADNKGKPVANVEIKRGKPVFPGRKVDYYGRVKDLRLKPGKYTAKIEFTDMDRRIKIIDTQKKFKLNKNGKTQ